MSTTRTRYTAEYDYPGSFFPESVTRELDAPTIEAALAVAPDEGEGSYFRRDGWYAVTIRSVPEKLYTSGDDTRWLRDGDPATVGRWVIGETHHADTIDPDGPRGPDENRILIANLRSNSPTSTGILTRCGNWQPLMDGDTVLTPAEVAR